MYISVFFKSTLCVLLTGGTLAPKYCQIALSNRDFFFSLSFSPSLLSLCPSPHFSLSPVLSAPLSLVKNVG